MGDPEVGRRIREAREAAGLTQKQLADAVGLKHPQSISNAERGVSQLEMVYLKRAATVTSKPLSFFVDQQPPVSAATNGETLRVDEPALRQMVEEAVEGALAETNAMLRRLLDEERPESRAGGLGDR